MPALVRVVARLAQFVLDVLQRELLVVALDGEDLLEHAFQAGLGARFPGHVELQEAVVGAGLDLGQVRNLDGVAEAAEVAVGVRDDDAGVPGWASGSLLPAEFASFVFQVASSKTARHSVSTWNLEPWNLELPETRRRRAGVAPMATGLASDRGWGYWTLRQRTVAAIMEEVSGAHDARVTDTTLAPVRFTGSRYSHGQRHGGESRGNDTSERVGRAHCHHWLRVDPAASPVSGGMRVQGRKSVGITANIASYQAGSRKSSRGRHFFCSGPRHRRKWRFFAACGGATTKISQPA